MAATLLPATYHRWHVFESGYGCCFYGHGKSLDPHWRLEWLWICLVLAAGVHLKLRAVL